MINIFKYKYANQSKREILIAITCFKASLLSFMTAFFLLLSSTEFKNIDASCLSFSIVRIDDAIFTVIEITSIAAVSNSSSITVLVVGITSPDFISCSCKDFRTKYPESVKNRIELIGNDDMLTRNTDPRETSSSRWNENCSVLHSLIVLEGSSSSLI